MGTEASFGNWLKQRRKMLDLSRDELAERIGCAVVTLYKIESGERRPSKQIAELLAQYLNIPSEDRPTFVAFARGSGDETWRGLSWGTRYNLGTKLPTQPSPLIGREQDIINVRKRLLDNDTQLLTLVGPPGIGKTRLSQAVARNVLNEFSDGVFLVFLASISDPALVSRAIAQALGLFEVGSQPRLEQLKTYLSDKQMLLVLDNFEQILPAATQVAELLTVAPFLKILATSRAPLRIRRERQFLVTSLALPTLNPLPEARNLSTYAAVELFIERAQAIQPHFSLTSENAQPIAAICHRLNGLPLAIELISARVKLLSPIELLERLHGHLLLTSDGLRDLEPRHRTLNAAISWSYDLLDSQEKTLFMRLGVFVGGFTLEAVEYVAHSELEEKDPKRTTLDILSRLVDKSLVTFQQGKVTRFSMLEPIREFARELLSTSGEDAVIHARHFDFFCTLAQKAGPKLFGSENRTPMNTLQIEYDNIRAALNWSLDPDVTVSLIDRAERAITLLRSLHIFFVQHGYFVEMHEWLDKLLTMEMPPSAARAYALQQAGFLARITGDFEQAMVRLNQAITLARSINAKLELGWALSDLGIVERDQGNLESIIPLFSEALHLFQEIGDSRGIGHCLYCLAETYMLTGDFEVSSEFWEQGLQHFRHEQDKKHIAWGLEGLGNSAFLRGELAQAAKLHKESLMYKADTLDKLGIAYSLEGLAQTCAEQQPERAAILWGAAEQLRLNMNIPLDPSRRSIYTSLVSVVHARMSTEHFAEAWARGRSLTLEQSIDYALSEG